MKHLTSMVTTYLLALPIIANNSIAGDAAEQDISITVDDTALSLYGDDSNVTNVDETVNSTSALTNEAVDVDTSNTSSSNVIPEAIKSTKKNLSFFGKTNAQKDHLRTCDEALAEMMKKGNVIIDLSNTSDFTANGDNAMNAYYAKIIETRSFGTHSQNLLVILSKTGVTADFVTKWATIFQKDKKIVLLNLSENSSVDDSVIDALPAIFPKLYSLNLAYTNVTDIGISKIVALLETHGIGMLTCITLTGSKTSESGVASLKLAIQKAVELWKVKNPGKEYPLEGDGGIIFKKPQFTAKVKARKNPTPNLNLPTSIEVPEETAVATISDISPVTSEITQSDEPTQEQVLETLNDVDKIIAENSSTTTEQNVDSIDSSQVSGTLLS